MESRFQGRSLETSFGFDAGHGSRKSTFPGSGHQRTRSQAPAWERTVLEAPASLLAGGSLHGEPVSRQEP